MWPCTLLALVLALNSAFCQVDGNGAYRMKYGSGNPQYMAAEHRRQQHRRMLDQDQHAMSHPICLFQEAYNPDSCYFNSYHLPRVVPYSSVETLAGRLYWQWTKLGHICEGSRHRVMCEGHKANACIFTTSGCGVKFSVEQYFVLTLADKQSWGYRASRCDADGRVKERCNLLPDCNWVEVDYGGTCNLKYDLIEDVTLQRLVQRVLENGTADIQEYAATFNKGEVTDKLTAIFRTQACFHAEQKDTCLTLKYNYQGEERDLCEWSPFPEPDANEPPGGTCQFGKQGYYMAFFGHDAAITVEWNKWNKLCTKYSGDDDEAAACFAAYLNETTSST